jgi:hypothetical protein
MAQATKYFASIAWPFHLRPAYALVVRVTWDNEVPDSPYRAEIETEFEEIGLQALRERCVVLHKALEPHAFYADTSSEGLVGAFYEGSKTDDAIPLTPPPYVDKGDLSSLCFQAVRELTRLDKQVLFLGDSPIRGHIRNLPQDKPIQIEKYPPVAALGYLAAALQLWLQLETTNKPKNFLARVIEDASQPGGFEEDRFNYAAPEGAELEAKLMSDYGEGLRGY